MNEDYKYTVCTYCITFNHSKYIEDTLRGFAMQEVSSPAVFAIVDDASTDIEQTILIQWAERNLDYGEEGYRKKEDYGDLLFGRMRNKPNLWFAITLLKENHHSRNKSKDPYFDKWLSQSKYVAFCEGDDYWIHPLKLQRQVDFMEENPDFSMCFHNAVVTYDNLDKASCLFNNFVKNRELHLSELLDKWICPTQSLLIRNPLFPLFPIKGSIIGGDWRVVLHCAANGRIWGMKAVMACYRKTDLPSSLSNAYSRRSDEIFLKKVPVLVGFDEYTGGKYHDLVSKYISYYLKMGQIVAFKKKHGMMATCLLKPFSLLEIFWKRYIRPKLDKNAPTYSA